MITILRCETCGHQTCIHGYCPCCDECKDCFDGKYYPEDIDDRVELERDQYIKTGLDESNDPNTW